MDRERVRRMAARSLFFGARVEVFPVEPVTPLPLAEILASAGPLLGRPIEAMACPLCGCRP